MSKKISIDDFINLASFFIKTRFLDQAMDKILNRLDEFEKLSGGENMLKTFGELIKMLKELELEPRDKKLLPIIEQGQTYKISMTDMDMSIHPNVEEFLVEMYIIYDKIKNNKPISKHEIMANVFHTDKATMSEMEVFCASFEKIMVDCDFETPDMRGIQKNLLQDIMKDMIKCERYEECAFIRDKANKIK